MSNIVNEAVVAYAEAVWGRDLDGMVYAYDTLVLLALMTPQTPGPEYTQILQAALEEHKNLREQILLGECFGPINAET